MSPKGERVAVAVGNHITILRKDEDYQQPYGTFASKIYYLISSSEVDEMMLELWNLNVLIRHFVC